MRRAAPLRTTLFALALSAALLAACAGQDDPNGEGTGESTTPGRWAGQVAGTDLFVALTAAETGETVAYVCDNDDLAVWLRGQAEGDSVALAADAGLALQADLGTDAAAGTVTLADGQSVAFTAPAVSGDAGLYRAEETIDGEPVVTGLILLPDGQHAGAIIRAGRIISIPFTFDPANPVLTLDGTAMEAALVSP